MRNVYLLKEILQLYDYKVASNNKWICEQYVEEYFLLRF